MDGKISFLCGDRESVYEAGSFVYLPRGTLHTFRNLEEQQTRLLVIITPAGLEEFFYSIGTPAIDLSTPPAFDPAVMDKLLALTDKYHMEIILPGTK